MLIQLAKEALEIILRSGKQDLEMISACINEARSHKKNPDWTTQWVLEAVLLNSIASPIEYPPAMYRYDA